MAFKNFPLTLFVLVFYFKAATNTTALSSREWDRQDAERFVGIFCNKHMAENNMVLPRVSWWITMTLLVAFLPVLAFNYELPSCDKSFEFQIDRQQHPGLHR